jgi:NitT/TauT family transport system ATP-binding protein
MLALNHEEAVTSHEATASPSSKPSFVDVLSANKIYADGTEALAPVDLSIAPGEFLTLIGPSGCGKSTLLKLVANLIEPTDGRLQWWRGGFDQVGGEGRRLAFVFQDATLMPWARISSNVSLPLDLAGVPSAQSKPRVAEALKRVGLEGFENRYPRQLSGGMRMRVSIARALVTNPDLLLMDEPFGALDEFTRNRLDSDLLALWWERKLTCVFVTHSIYEAVFLSTRVVVMAARPGRIYRVMEIDEPQPRGEAFRNSSRFADLCRQLSAWLADASLPSPVRASP